MYVTAHILHACFPTLTRGGVRCRCIPRRAQYEMTCMQSHSHEYTVSHCYAAGVTYQPPPPHQSDTPTQLLADANARLLMSVGNAEEVSLKGRVTQIYKTHFRTCTWDHRDVSAVRRIQRCL